MAECFYQMPKCRFCGNETTQPGSVYCSYCGASLLVQQTGSYGGSYSTQPPEYYQTGARLSAEMYEQRYERALRKAEQMGTAVVILSVIMLILLI